MKGRDRERELLKTEWSGLYEEVASILCRHDPVGLCLPDVNPDEYEPEVDTILPRLQDAASVEDVRRIIYEEFLRWFSVNGESSPSDWTREYVGPEERYHNIAAEIWEAYQNRSK